MEAPLLLPDFYPDLYQTPSAVHNDYVATIHAIEILNNLKPQSMTSGQQSCPSLTLF